MWPNDQENLILRNSKIPSYAKFRILKIGRMMEDNGKREGATRRPVGPGKVAGWFERRGDCVVHPALESKGRKNVLSFSLEINHFSNSMFVTRWATRGIGWKAG